MPNCRRAANTPRQRICVRLNLVKIFKNFYFTSTLFWNKELNMENEICLIFTTTNSRTKAETIAETLVSEKLAACVQIGSEIKSVYVWEGKSYNETEFPITIKASVSRLDELKARFSDLHNYECPEWVCLKAEASAGYFDWVEKSCKNPAL